MPEPMETLSGQGDSGNQNIQPGSIGREDLKNAAFVKRKENLILYGPVGTGK